MSQAYVFVTRKVGLGSPDNVCIWNTDLVASCRSTRLANHQPEQGSDDLQSKKNRRVHWEKNPGIGEYDEGREADRPQHHAHELFLALELYLLYLSA